MDLARFKKPSRYMNHEVNSVHKGDGLRVALCFPDTYEIGMSHIGLKILYSIINGSAHASAERVYAPWTDVEEYLRRNGLPLTSLEQNRPLGDFDIIGFTLQYELSYTNILNMLDLGGIPVRSEERRDGSPLVIAGGPCAVNPLPLAPFIDAFVIGDGEDVILEMIEAVRKCGGGSRDPGVSSGNKKDVLDSIAEIEGVYVPSVHDRTKKRIRRRVVADLDSAPFPDTPVVPYMAIIHDRAAIEVSRGCTRGCRFCQAGMIYRPLRERSLMNVLSLAERSVSSTGYEEVSFTSLSTGDYSCLLPLIREFNGRHRRDHISVSLPSLRVGSINSDVLKEIKSVRKTGFTIAPEAGTKRLRDVINKCLSDEEYDAALSRIFSEGWQNLKLYFMIGLPTETMADIDGIIDMALHASRKGREITKRSVNVNIGISAFVPKPHTPFQWTGQVPAREIREKQDYLKDAFRRKRINFKGQHVENSLLEAVFSRGGTECAVLLEEAWKQGCRFDGWAEMFDFSKWLQAADRTGMDIHAYAERELDPDGDLPWEMIDTGITKNFLKAEYGRSFQLKTTADCRTVCTGCGLDCKIKDTGVKNEMLISSPVIPLQTAKTGGEHATAVPPAKGHAIMKVRMQFSKTGMLRYLSHNEMMTAMLRALRRARIPVAYSSGFHPHPKISFGPALPAGVEGLREYFDAELAEPANISDIPEKLNSVLPAGLRVVRSVSVQPKERSLNDFISRYEYELPVSSESAGQMLAFMDRETCLISRDDDRRDREGTGAALSGKSIDIRRMVEKADLHDGTAVLTLADTKEAKVRLHEILREMFQRPVAEIQALPVKRIRVYGYNSGVWAEPIEER